MARFRLKLDGLAKLRKASTTTGGAELSDTGLAAAIGVHRSTVYRILHDEMPPGIPFLAGIVLTFGAEWFNDLFEAIPDEPATEDVAS